MQYSVTAAPNEITPTNVFIPIHTTFAHNPEFPRDAASVGVTLIPPNGSSLPRSILNGLTGPSIAFNVISAPGCEARGQTFYIAHKLALKMLEHEVFKGLLIGGYHEYLSKLITHLHPQLTEEGANFLKLVPYNMEVLFSFDRTITTTGPIEHAVSMRTDIYASDSHYNKNRAARTAALLNRLIFSEYFDTLPGATPMAQFIVDYLNQQIT